MEECIKMTIDSGIIELDYAPAGQRIIVRDYDIQGYIKKDLKIDATGLYYREIIFEGTG